MDFHAQMLPISRKSVFREEGWYVWCSTMTKEAGKYCLLYSRWPRSTGRNGWVTDSQICLALSDSPLGPFRHEKVLFTRESSERWDRDCFHNPALFDWGGLHYLYYMGNHGNGEYWDHRNHQRVGVAWSRSVYGPWTRLEHPVIDVSEKGFDSLMTSNPTATAAGDEVFMLYKGVSRQGELPKGGAVVCGAARAKTPLGPFVKEPEPLMVNPENDWSVEDPFVWYRNGTWYALVKDFQGYFTGLGESSTALFVSRDGAHFAPDEEHPLAFQRELQWEDGVIQRVSNMERPQIFFEPGKAPVLLCAVAADREWEDTFCVQIPLKEGFGE